MIPGTAITYTPEVATTPIQGEVIKILPKNMLYVTVENETTPSGKTIWHNTTTYGSTLIIHESQIENHERKTK